MSKNIILCSDGTWDKGGDGTPSNVWQLYQTLDLETTEPRQVAFYEDGVGTGNFRLFKTLGGAFGFGLRRNVCHLYQHLLNHYEPGDRIYLFGFSRGAYTIWLLTQMVAEYGATAEITDHLADAFEAIRQKYASGKNTEAPAELRARLGIQQDPTDPSSDNFVAIHFVGLWDTVDALGGPYDQLKGIINKLYTYQFHKLSRKPVANIKQGYQALAIDEARAPFLPVLWDESEQLPDQKIEQVWFAGVHSNIGGGYPKPGLSLVTFSWMLDKAKSAGLEIIELESTILHNRANVHSRLYDSRAGLAAYYPYRPRNIGFFQREHAKTTARIHYSALERISWGTNGYAPANLPVDFIVIDRPQDSTLPDQEQIAERLSNQQQERQQTSSLVSKQIQLYWAFLVFSLITVGASFYYMWGDKYRDHSGLPMLEKKCIQGVQSIKGILHDFTIEEILLASCHNLWFTLLAVIIFAILLFRKSMLFNRIESISKRVWQNVFRPMMG